MVASFKAKAVTKSYVHLPGSGSVKKAGVSFCDLSRGSNLAAAIPVPQPVGMPRSLTAKQTASTIASISHLHDSNLAASIPVPQIMGMPRCVTARQASSAGTSTTHSQGSNHAASTHVPQNMGMSRCVTAREAPSTVTSTTHKRPINDDATKSHKILLVDTNQNIARNSIGLIVKPVSVIAAPVTVLPQEINNNLTPTINNPNNELLKGNTKHTKFITINNIEYDVTKLHEENSQLASENTSIQQQVSMFMQLFRNPQRLESVLQKQGLLPEHP